MTPEELGTLTTVYRRLSPDIRDLLARWVGVQLAELGIPKRQRLDLQAALLDLDGDEQTGDLARRLRMTRRDADMSVDGLQTASEARLGRPASRGKV